jgi:hypothetical protein
MKERRKKKRNSVKVGQQRKTDRSGAGKAGTLFSFLVVSLPFSPVAWLDFIGRFHPIRMM